MPGPLTDEERAKLAQALQAYEAVNPFAPALLASNRWGAAHRPEMRAMLQTAATPAQGYGQMGDEVRPRGTLPILTMANTVADRTVRPAIAPYAGKEDEVVASDMAQPTKAIGIPAPTNVPASGGDPALQQALAPMAAQGRLPTSIRVAPQDEDEDFGATMKAWTKAAGAGAAKGAK